MNIDTITKTLGGYSPEANNASTAISNGLLPIGLIFLSVFFLIDLLNWKHFLNRREKRIPAQMWLEFGFKYFIGVIMLMIFGYVLDAISDTSILITKRINSIYPPSTYSFTYTETDYGNFLRSMLFNSIGWILEKIAQVIVYILIFMRYLDLYFLKAIAPVMIGFYYSDEFRPTVMNFFKSYVAYSLLSVVLLIFTILYGLIFTEDRLNSVATGEEATAGFLLMVKGIIYILIIVGSTRKIKSLVGVQ